MAELQPSKLATRVRFPSPAPGRASQGGVMAAAADSKSAIREYVRVRVPLLAPAVAPCGASVGRSNAGRRTKRLEGCPSGRWCNLGKVVWAQVHRGFESPPLRQLSSQQLIFSVRQSARRMRPRAATLLCAQIKTTAGGEKRGKPHPAIRKICYLA